MKLLTTESCQIMVQSTVLRLNRGMDGAEGSRTEHRSIGGGDRFLLDVGSGPRTGRNWVDG